MDDSDLERLRARYQRENFSGEDTGWRDWSPSVSYLGRTRNECKKSSDSLQQRKALKIVLTNKRRRRIRGLASTGQQVRSDQQSECGREAGGDFAHAV